MTESPLRVGGRYELGDLLGRGGMADVRRAHDPVLGRDVAVKLLRTGDPVDRGRFDSEARLLALLAHENIVTVLDAGVDAGQPWLALELVDGDTLADRLAVLTPVQLAGVGVQVAAGLHHAHSHGVVHRDVKPSNVLIDRVGRARLTDFGIARLVDDGASLTLTGHTVGTAAYLAPEQVSGRPVTTATDVYALGLVLLEGLTGRREYDGPPVEAALARLHRSPLVPVSLPLGWPGLVAAMTATDPDDRPSAAAVAARLRELEAGRATRAVSLDADDTSAIPLVPPAPASRPAVVEVPDVARRRRRPLPVLAAPTAAPTAAPAATTTSARATLTRTPTATPAPATTTTQPVSTPASSHSRTPPAAHPRPGHRPASHGKPQSHSKPKSKGKSKGKPKGRSKH